MGQKEMCQKGENEMAKATAPPLEKTIVNSIIRALKDAGCRWVLKTHGGPFQASGIPDIICIAPLTGRFVGIEVKRPDGYGRLTELQASQIKRIESAGGVAGVAFSAEDALRYLAAANKPYKPILAGVEAQRRK